MPKSIRGAGEGITSVPQWFSQFPGFSYSEGEHCIQAFIRLAQFLKLVQNSKEYTHHFTQLSSVIARIVFCSKSVTPYNAFAIPFFKLFPSFGHDPNKSALTEFNRLMSAREWTKWKAIAKLTGRPSVQMKWRIMESMKLALADQVRRQGTENPRALVLAQTQPEQSEEVGQQQSQQPTGSDAQKAGLCASTSKGTQQGKQVAPKKAKKPKTEEQKAARRARKQRRKERKAAEKAAKETAKLKAAKLSNEKNVSTSQASPKQLTIQTRSQTNALREKLQRTRAESNASSDSFFDPAAEFFCKYQNFGYDPTKALIDEFERLAIQQQWKPGSKNYRKKRTECLIPGFEHDFYEIGSEDLGDYDDDEDEESGAGVSLQYMSKLSQWQALCGELGADPIPTTITQCKKVLSTYHININDLVEARELNRYSTTGLVSIRRFESASALAKDIMKTGRTFPKELAKRSGAIRALLIHVFQSARASRR